MAENDKDRCPFCRQPRELMVGDKPCRYPFHSNVTPDGTLVVAEGKVWTQDEARALAVQVEVLTTQNQGLREALATLANQYDSLESYVDSFRGI